MKAILVGDLHICDTIPLKRIDSFLDSQFSKIDKVGQIAEELQADYVFILGDIFDKARTETWAVNALASRFKKFHCRIYSLIGNHDLQGCRDGLKGTSLGTLFTTGILTKMDGDSEILNIPFRAINYTQEHRLKLYETSTPRIILSHNMLTPQVAPFTHIHFNDALEMAKNCFIFSGHFHYPFEKYNPRAKSRIVNPGTLIRTSIAEKDVDPGVIYFEATPEDLVTSYRKISLGAPSSEVVFNIAKHDESKSSELNLKNFIDSIVRTQFESQDLEKLVLEVGLENKVAENVIYEAINRIKVAKTLS